jgi:hypothetical protein
MSSAGSSRVRRTAAGPVRSRASGHSLIGPLFQLQHAIADDIPRRRLLRSRRLPDSWPTPAPGSARHRRATLTSMTSAVLPAPRSPASPCRFRRRSPGSDTRTALSGSCRTSIFAVGMLTLPLSSTRRISPAHVSAGSASYASGRRATPNSRPRCSGGRASAPASSRTRPAG